MFHPCGDVWWSSAKDIGYQDLRRTVKWDETTPTVKTKAPVKKKK